MSFYDFTVKDNNGNDKSLSEYKNKVVVVVNTATKCGLTPQYKALQDLYSKYADKGLVILDFPCNQFLSQAPGSNGEIEEFCSLNYGTKFPRFEKIEVNGKNACPLFVWLKKEAPKDIGNDESAKFEKKVKLFTLGIGETDIKWNFCKFIIDKNGNVAGRYSPALGPELMEEKIKSLL